MWAKAGESVGRPVGRLVGKRLARRPLPGCLSIRLSMGLSTDRAQRASRWPSGHRPHVHGLAEGSGLKDKPQDSLRRRKGVIAE